MLRLMCVTFAACIVLCSPVSAQNTVTTCGVVQQSDIGRSDSTFLGLETCYGCHYSGFPKDGAGERVGIRENDHWIRKDEVRIWLGKDETWGNDKHAQAYTALLSATGKKIGTAMGLHDIHLDKRCLACHTAYPIHEMKTVDGQTLGLIQKELYEKDLRLTVGVSCEGCHGAAGDWESQHASKEKWRFLEPEKKCEQGFYDVRSVISRTKLCLSCHLGNAAQGRVLTHEMYAAGHPPLPAFEIETFENQMPKHWRHLSEKAELLDEFLARTGNKFNPDALHHTKSLLVAALVSRSESLRLTADLADLAEGAVSEQIPKPRWPDFAQFDCYACHHDLKTESWRQTAQHSGNPGRPVLIPWPAALAQLAAIRIPDSDEAARDFAAVRSATLMSPFGDREMLIKAARASADSSDKLALALDSQELTMADGTVILEQITEMAATETLDYDSARQLVWAFIVVQQELKSCGEQGASSQLVDEELTSVKQMFVLKLKDGRPAKHQIPGAAEESDVKEVDLKTVLPPIANYDAIAFQKVFAELRQLHQKPQEVAP